MPPSQHTQWPPLNRLTNKQLFNPARCPLGSTSTNSLYSPPNPFAPLQGVYLPSYFLLPLQSTNPSTTTNRKGIHVPNYFIHIFENHIHHLSYTRLSTQHTLHFQHTHFCTQTNNSHTCTTSLHYHHNTLHYLLTTYPIHYLSYISPPQPNPLYFQPPQSTATTYDIQSEYQ